jgi:hypothetical protein
MILIVLFADRGIETTDLPMTMAGHDRQDLPSFGYPIRGLRRLASTPRCWQGGAGAGAPQEFGNVRQREYGTEKRPTAQFLNRPKGTLPTHLTM